MGVDTPLLFAQSATMKPSHFALAWWLAVGTPSILAVAGASEAPRAADLAAPVPVMADGQAINVAGCAAPFVGDFDQDGVNDLLVGQFDLGRLRVYRNVGSEARPKFDDFRWFTAEDRIACVPAGCLVGFTPQLVDFDGDGLTDVVSGSQQGELYLFRRQGDGTFAEAEVLENQQSELTLGRFFFCFLPLR